MTARKYYTLVINHGTDADPQWGIHFGDYDRQTVVDERKDLKEGSDPVPLRRSAIITSADDQASINAAVAKLNEK